MIFINSFLQTAVLPTLILFFLQLFLFHCPTKCAYVLTISVRQKARRLRLFPLHLPVALCVLVPVLWLGLLVYQADKSFDAVRYFRDQFDQSALIKKEYVDPNTVQLTFPEKKRNLIMIHMESAETSAQDKANGGIFDTNYIPEMTQLAKDNVSFSQSDLLEGASIAPACGWTMAALVAQTSGLPLKLFTYSGTDDANGTDVNNSMNRYEYFLPGATTLGDILEEEGYHNFFISGSDFDFGGRANYFTQHGNYEIYDYYSATADGKIPEDYCVWWGLEDQKLYSYAKEQLLRLADGEEPFNFSLLTVDTHAQDGYVCDICPDTYDDQYANVWACASAQVNEFVEWIQQQDFYENPPL